MKKAEVWKTSDGEVFDDEEMAYQHERYLVISEKLGKVAENLWGHQIHAIVEFNVNDFKDKFISSYEILKYSIESIEHDLEKLRGDDEDGTEHKNRSEIRKKGGSGPEIEKKIKNADNERNEKSVSEKTERHRKSPRTLKRKVKVE